MDQILEAVTEWLQDNWIKFLTGLFIMAIGWFFGQRRAQANWKKKEFLDRLNVSLNSMEQNSTEKTLLIRTVLEKSCKDVFLNDVAVGCIPHIAVGAGVAGGVLVGNRSFRFTLDKIERAGHGRSVAARSFDVCQGAGGERVSAAQSGGDSGGDRRADG